MGHDFNPRSPDGERQSGLLVLGLAVDISIHAPRMGSNRGWDEILDQCLCISIHAPRMGSDQVRLVSRQSLKDFNPRSPDGERPNQLLTNPSSQGISIHAPRMGSDAGLALGGDTWPHISIHAPRMGSDRENGHLRPRYGQNHPFSTLIVSQIVVDVLGTVRKSQKHQRTSHYEVIKQPERRK